MRQTEGGMYEREATEKTDRKERMDFRDGTETDKRDMHEKRDKTRQRRVEMETDTNEIR